MMAPPIIVTEDTPPDMLAGSMDLTVVLPDGHSLKMSIERSTPMMDLLVQITTANKMSPAGFIIKPLNDQGTLPYKPSTPIGALDAWTIHVVPKQHSQYTAVKKPRKTLNQPFEQTFRLQVNLPRNQLYVVRISPKTRLTDILLQVCSEKNLDPLKYSLRHPSNLDQVLNLSCTLADYKLQEVTLVCNRSHPVEVSTVDIMSLQREISNPAYRNNLCEGSVSSGSLEGRSLSPVPSDESSASPPPPPLPPSRPTRKRRPAPKPPMINKRILTEDKHHNGIQPSTMISHSRNSSDSSGYHEASVLSESPQNNSVPETLSRRKMASVSEASQNLSQSMTDITTIQSSLKQATSYNSITSLSSATGRKKKTAPPPPPVSKNKASLIEDQLRTPSVSSTASSTTTLDGNEVNVAVKSATLPPSSRFNTESKELSPLSSLSSTTKVDVESPATTQVAPAPRPRSKLFGASEQDFSPIYSESRVENKPPSSKKQPAPQPKPRKLLSPSSLHVENGLDTDIKDLEFPKKPESVKEIGNFNRLSIFMNKKLPSSVFDTHKACIDEMAFKFDLKDSTDVIIGSTEIQNYTYTDNQKQENIPESDSFLLENDITYQDTNISKPVVWHGEDCDGQAPSPGLGQTACGSNTEPDIDSSEIRMADEEIDQIFTNATSCLFHLQSGIKETPMPSLPTFSSPPSLLTHFDLKQQLQSEGQEWEYKLPAPPTFRDETKSPSLTEFGTVTIGQFSDVLCLENVNQINSNKTDIEKYILSEDITKEDNTYIDCAKIEPLTNSLNSTKCSNVENDIHIEMPKIKSETSYVEHENFIQNNEECMIGDVERNLINELTSSIIQRPNKVVENNHLIQRLSSNSALENFKITTYKDTKPVEVFEDDSIKSSVGEKRDKSKDDAAFRAPKARFKEPHLSRTSSFSMENKLNGPVIKRSVSYVSLLAANMPRTSQPYRAHLLRQLGKDSQDPWPQLRKTTSEFNIGNKDDRLKDPSFWQEDSSELQSVQVLRNIMSQSHANVTSSFDEQDDPTDRHQRDPLTSGHREDTSDKTAESKMWRRSQSNEVTPVNWVLKSNLGNSESLDQECLKSLTSSQRGPSINLSTWSERPKRQISIKNDCDYTSGFGKKSNGQEDIATSVIPNKDSTSSTKMIHSTNSSVYIEIPSKNESFKLEGRSKSVGDLSRIPVVRAVEFKKPFAVHGFDRTVLKPVQILDNSNNSNGLIGESSTSDVLHNIEEDRFIGVNSLAKKFGEPHKKPISPHVSNNVESSIKESNFNNVKSPYVNNKSSFSNVHIANKIDGSIFRTSKHVQQPNDSLSKQPNEVDSTTSVVKAQARRRSGGFMESNSQFMNTYLPKNKNSSLDNKTPKLNGTTENTTVTKFLSDPKTITNSNISISTNNVHKSDKSAEYNRLSQTFDKNTRPLNLQPVVKGFRISTEKSSSLLKDKTSQSSSMTKDSTLMSINLSNNVMNSELPAYKTMCHRALGSSSTSSSSTENIKESTKEKNTDKVLSSFLSESEHKVHHNDITPSPPPMPVLKPVGVRLLPPPETNPRDQLMQSIRSFGKDSLKKVLNETKSSD